MPAVIRRNERSWAISMISDINIRLKNLNLKIVRAGGETTISTGHQSMFPDVLLYGDADQTQVLQGWELKLPDTPITDTTFIKDAQRKATSLGLNSCFIWNFNAGVLYVRRNNGGFEIAKQWNETSNIRTRDDVERNKHEWLPVIERILIEINEFLITGEIHGAELGDIISDTIIAVIIERNKALVSAELQTVCSANAVVGAYISVWWDDIQSEFVSDEANKYDAYAKIVLLNWANRIVFAHLIKRSHNAAMAVNYLSFDTSIADANAIYERITAGCDFYNIFSGMENNDLLPAETWHDLMDLNVFLTNNGVHQIEQTALQTILEHTVAISQREVNGQFTTPAVLADILVRLTTHDWTGQTIDPCCGTGSIPKAVIKHKKENLKNVTKAIETTWAADKFSFPLQIANISMTDADTINIPNRIFRKNVFSLMAGDNIRITNPVNGEQVAFSIPRYATIVSNLPFVPFEKISDTDWKYTDIIAEDVRSSTGIALSNRSDYYMFIIFALYKLLEENGRIGIITSNSWLGTIAGREFFPAVNRYFKIEQIHISNAARWFNNAKVVTIITILSKRPYIGDVPPDETTAFCTWQKNLEELENVEADRDKLINSALLDRELAPEVMKLKAYRHSDIVALNEMSVSLSALFHNVLWLLDIKDKLTPISEVYDVVRGERRGWDTMFYPAPGHGIEQCYIRKVLKNSKAINSLFASADCDAFCCSRSVEELQNLNHTGAISWIERFRHGVNQTGRPLPQVLARSNMHWYEMQDTNVADIVTTMNPDRRLFFAKFEEPSFINQRLIGLKSKRQYPDAELNHALLNSMLGMFYIEAVGFGRGLGALDISSTTIRNAYMLNPRLLNTQQRDRILKKFQALLQRTVLFTDQELSSADRAEFDREVLAAYGIDRYYDDIKASLLSMQRMRLMVR